MRRKPERDMLNSDQKRHLLERVREAKSEHESATKNFPEPAKLRELRKKIASMESVRDQLIERIEAEEEKLSQLEGKHEESSKAEKTKVKTRLSQLVLKAKETIHFGTVEDSLNAVRELEAFKV